MITILNIFSLILVFLILIIPFLYLIYLCSRIIKCDKDIALFISKKNNIFFLVMYILFPPVLWYRLTYFIVREKYRILSVIITFFFLYWFLVLSDVLSGFSRKIPYGISLSYILFYLLLYIIPILFIIRYFLIRKDRQDKHDAQD